MRLTSGSPVELLVRAAMVCAPLLLLASTVAYMATDELGEGGPGGLLQVVAMALFVLVLLGLVARVADVAPRAAAVLLLLGCLGCAGGVGYGVNAIVTGVDGLDLNHVDGAAVILRVIGPIFPVAFLGLGVTLLRTRRAPAPAAVLVIVAAVLFPVSRIAGIEVLALVVDLLFVVGLTGIAMTTGRDRIGPVSAAAPELSPSR